ncbi:MAG TPA: helicase C-terminal domain-containing protein, partial [Bacillota bacterium]|nr:helicase C-terminal domain-containing protein [Bacillota bacterium]
IEGATRLSESFFDQKKSIILTSATLTVRQSFSFIKKKLGLMKETCQTYHLPSPFPFSEQVQLLVPNDFPHINEQAEEFIYATCEAIISLAKITEGRMLVLFTSYDMLKSAHQILQETLNINKYTLIAQGISSGSRSRLKRSFQTYENAILLGTSSFWEGIDIPGEDLTALMIVRLPFQPPNDPVYEAKATALQQEKKNPFFELALPNAVIRFKQGFGRLIRSVNDRGIVFICDSRIVTAKYGHFFIRSIPEVPLTYDSTSTLIKTVNEWL